MWLMGAVRDLPSFRSHFKLAAEAPQYSLVSLSMPLHKIRVSRGETFLEHKNLCRQSPAACILDGTQRFAFMALMEFIYITLSLRV